MNHRLGIAEIARELGVSRNVVSVWRHRGKLPPPDAELASGPVWDRTKKFERWLKEMKHHA